MLKPSFFFYDFPVRYLKSGKLWQGGKKTVGEQNHSVPHGWSPLRKTIPSFWTPTPFPTAKIFRFLPVPHNKLKHHRCSTSTKNSLLNKLKHHHCSTPTKNSLLYWIYTTKNEINSHLGSSCEQASSKR